MEVIQENGQPMVFIFKWLFIESASKRSMYSLWPRHKEIRESLFAGLQASVSLGLFGTLVEGKKLLSKLQNGGD